MKMSLNAYDKKKRQTEYLENVSWYCQKQNKATSSFQQVLCATYLSSEILVTHIQINNIRIFEYKNSERRWITSTNKVCEQRERSWKNRECHCESTLRDGAARTKHATPSHSATVDGPSLLHLAFPRSLSSSYIINLLRRSKRNYILQLQYTRSDSTYWWWWWWWLRRWWIK